MAILQSQIDPNSESFRTNRRDMLALVEQFRALEARADCLRAPPVRELKLNA